MFIVLRHSPNLPPESRVESLEGQRVVLDPNRITRPRPDWEHVERPNLMARPTGRYETDDDGERAEVWEIGPVDL